MTKMNNTVEATCRECGRIWTKRLLVDVSTLNENALKVIKKSVCDDCRTHMSERFVKRHLGKFYEEED
jgi:hypothetical protein